MSAVASLARASARPKLVSGGGFDTPARAALAIAIASRTAEAEALAKLQLARETLWDNAQAARAKLANAEAALETAKQAASAYMLAEAIGKAGTPPMTVKGARALVQEADDDLAAAIAARDGLNAGIIEGEANVAIAQKRVKQAAADVMRESPVVQGLMTEVLRLQRELIQSGRTLSWLMSRDILPSPATSPSRSDDPHYEAGRLRTFIDALPVQSLPGATENSHYNWLIFSNVPAWEAALAALETDATAALPPA